jgi:phage tail sheath gpL-like
MLNNITFEEIPSSIRKPGKYFEFNTKLAVRTLPNNKQRLLLIGQKTSSGAHPALLPVQIFSDVQAGKYFGFGSMLHLMARAAIIANPYVDLTCVALDDVNGSSKAERTITITGSANVSGVIVFYIGNERVDVNISKDDSQNVIAQKVVNEINKKSILPVTASVNESQQNVIVLKAKNAGVVSYEIGLEYENTITGITISDTYWNGGGSDPDIILALQKVFPENYNIIVTPYNYNDSLVKLRDYLDTVSNGIEQRGAIGVFALTHELSDATTLASLMNHGRMLCAYLRGTRSISYELASCMGAVIASEEDPARPLNTLELKGINPPKVADRLTRQEQENCLYNGVTPIEVDTGEKVRIVRAVSTYIADESGMEDISLLDITTIRTLDYVRKACKERIALRFPREKLSSKTPNKVKTELLDVLKKLEELEIVENVDMNKDNLIVERDTKDPNRLNAKIPTDVVNGLHIFAGRIDLIL